MSVDVTIYKTVMFSDLFQFKIGKEVKFIICYNERINFCDTLKWRWILFSSEKTYFDIIKEVV